MEFRSTTELYTSFIDFIKLDLKNERRIANRRMFNVFLWSFLIPFFATLMLIVFVKLHVLPRTWSRYFDWVILVSPIVYSIYIVSSEVFIEVPGFFKRGGGIFNLNQAVAQNKWRENICIQLENHISANIRDWKWIYENFHLDLISLRNHTRNLTALAGAVIYFLLQGIDFLDVKESHESIVKSGNLTKLFEASSNNLTQLIAISVVLMLLYLSGQQSHQALQRYLHCVHLIVFKKEPKAQAVDAA